MHVACAAVAVLLATATVAADADSCVTTGSTANGSSHEDGIANAASLQMLQQQLHLRGDGAPGGLNAHRGHRVLSQSRAAQRADDTIAQQGWCGYSQQNGFFTALLPPRPANGFMLEISHAMRGTGVARFLVTAMTTSGTYTDEFGFLTEYAYPAEETSSTMFEFRMAEDGISVDVYQPLMNIRTSDKQSRRALARGLGTGWIASLPTYTCSEEGQFIVNANDPESKPRVRDFVGAPFSEGTKARSPSLLESFVPDSVVVNGEDLLRQGFFVVQSVARASYRTLSVRAFKQNLDVNAEFIMPDGLPMDVGFSLVWLRDKPMQARASDDRALYFTTDFQDKGVHSEYEHELPADSVDRSVSLIWRYDLSSLPRNEIRVYVDPTVPVRWRPYFRKGIEAWNSAFELIGKPHTMKAVLPGDKGWPSDYNVADARYSTISWVFTNAVVSMGIAKVDPRSGEIMKSDITMSDGWVKSWLGDLDLELPNATHWIDMNQGYRRESFTATDSTKGGSLLALRRAALEAGHNPNSDWGHGLSLLAVGAGAPLTPAQREQLVGQGLQDIVTHETGHILGLRHNFKGTMAVSYECTRNRSCTQEHGLSASVMDYTPLNLPSQDAPDVHIFTPVLGAYDKLAIKYGYMDVPNDNKAAEDASQVPELEEVLRGAEAVGSCYDSDQSSEEDPSCRAYDLTDDPVRWFDSQIRLLANVQRTLLNASVLPGTSVTRYGESVLKVLNLALTNALDCATWLGGVRNSYVHRRVDGRLPDGARKPVPAEQQRRALQVVLRMLRPQQIGLLPPKENFPYLVQGDNEKVFTLDLGEKVRIIRNHLMDSILSAAVLKRMHTQDQLGAVAGERSLGCGDFLALLVDGVMGGSVAATRSADWDLQVMLVERLGSLYASQSLPEEIISHVLHHLKRINDDVQASLLLVPAAGDTTPPPVREHLLTLRQHLQAAVCPGTSPECLSLLLQSRAALRYGRVGAALPAMLVGLLAASAA